MTRGVLESRADREQQAHQSCVVRDRKEGKAYISNFITEPSPRGVWDQFLVPTHIGISKPIWSRPSLLRLRHGVQLASGIVTVCVGSQDGKRCDSGQTGKEVRQGSRGPVVRGAGWVVVSPAQFCPHVPSVEEFPLQCW